MKCLALGVCAAGLGVELRAAVYSAIAGVKVAFSLFQALEHLQKADKNYS